MTFRKAERTQAKLKIALTGPSGSGKTFSGLLIAAGIGKKIAVVDTENKSASLYAGMDKGPLAGMEFDILEIDPPYTIPKYLEAIEAADKGGYDVLMIDSISHAWAGEGGLLDKKTALDNRPNSNSYTNWAPITKEHELFKARLLNSDIHLICTMRSKQDYVLEDNDRGKKAPKKVGMAPIQRDGMEYEFTTVLDIAMDHNAVASKDRTSLFDGQVFKPSKETGAKIMKWLKAGKPVEKPAAAPAAEPAAQAERPPLADFPDEFNSVMATAAQKVKIAAGIKALHELGRSDQTIWKGITAHVKKAHGREVVETTALTEAEAETAIAYVTNWAEHLRAEAAKAAAAGRA